MKVLQSFLALIGLISVACATQREEVIDRSIINETKSAAEKYFRNLLKKVTQGESVEENTFKIIQDETELRLAFCNLYNRNNETDGNLDKRDKRLISEMRKLNIKLMKIEEKLVGIENSIRRIASRDEP